MTIFSALTTADGTPRMALKYEDISNSDSSKAVFSADQILEEGWSRREYPVVRLDAPIPWTLESNQYRSWNFYIHCWDMLDNLLKAHSQTNDPKYIEAALPVVVDWIEKHPGGLINARSPFAWYDMAVGLRSYRLAYVLDVATEANLLDGTQKILLQASMEDHAAYLEDDNNIVYHNNHGYYQVAGQLAMGRRFASQFPRMQKALEQGQHRLVSMLEQQFTSEGIHREHSPDYHRMVYDTLKALIDTGLVNERATIDKASQIEEALSWFVTPSQHIANLGDSDYRSLRRKPDEALRKWSSSAMRHLVSGGAKGRLPDADHQAFLEGGYFAVRRASAFDPQRLSASSYLVQTAAFHSRTHKQADDLSFIWSDRGSDLLVDAGRYGYIGKAAQGSDLWLDGHWYDDPNRVYCESTRAHNTLEFDGLNYPRKGVKPYGSALKRWTSDASTGLIAVETECRHFGSIRRVRVLVFNPGSWLLVFDWYHDNNDQRHQVKQWFHLSPHLQLTQEVEGYLVSVPGSTQPLRVKALLRGASESRAYLGETEPMQGWWSGKERDIVPAYAFCYQSNNTSAGSMATLFTFSNELHTDHEWSKVNVSGKKAQFSWHDELGRHQLKLDRSTEANPLGVEYLVTSKKMKG
jgi:hypothetical protein